MDSAEPEAALVGLLLAPEHGCRRAYEKTLGGRRGLIGPAFVDHKGPPDLPMFTPLRSAVGRTGATGTRPRSQAGTAGAGHSRDHRSVLKCDVRRPPRRTGHRSTLGRGRAGDASHGESSLASAISQQLGLAYTYFAWTQSAALTLQRTFSTSPLTVHVTLVTVHLINTGVDGRRPCST